ncbi:endonuclease Q family protein [Bacillus sp. RAR_GA_16]|uniref:endonuclease Q family protein n=1 Tax=Bacillus sp. RAR_GA_16 TaxID=2876774 RepID=UPI001CCB4140|nr:endonuclease Q family protein [Bacillus sp. RAR_GA_16]MCA0170974.1 endonuclease Q family protein [Bacillus sp. RAR_GA_16]
MNSCYADFHIHIGRTRSNKPVKITGSKSLTLSSILKEAGIRKGLNMIGVIDCHVPEVIAEIEESIVSGLSYELRDGGIRFNTLTLILGTEIEIYDKNCHGPIHVLVYLPDLAKMKHFSEWLKHRMKNVTLSSQRIYEKAVVIQEKIRELEGVFIPAHVFTPFKSVYGKGVHRSISEVFDLSQIDGVELGLSSDTKMADQLHELHNFPYLTNSDAHSLQKIAREYQLLTVKEASFLEWKKALNGEGGRGIKANFGLSPKLGKYYVTLCSRCHTPVHQIPCETCGGQEVVKGVSNRIQELSSAVSFPERPPYIHHIPLDFLPGLGAKTYERLLMTFGTEMNILHHVCESDLAEVVGKTLAHLIVLSRSGELEIKQGGGGSYGKVIY